MKKWMFITLAVLYFLGCEKLAPISQSSSSSSKTSYAPLYPIQSDWQDFAPGTITYDYNYAAVSPNLKLAEERWSRYVGDHAQIEDGFSKNYYILANLELMRVYYLQGKRQEGDVILKKFDYSQMDAPL